MEDDGSSSSVDSYETDSGWDDHDDDRLPFFGILTKGASMRLRRAGGMDIENASSTGTNDRDGGSRRKRPSRRSICEALSTYLLLASVIFFLYANFLSSADSYISDPHKTVRERTKDRLQSAKSKNVFKNYEIYKEENKRKKKSTEDLPDGCTRPDWQQLNYPNCNAIHEISLQEIQRGTAKGKYLANGLWRDVFKVGDDAVIKVLKKEHDVDDRNFDRHRRDALVMEQLTRHPHVVDVYGFCGNTILTEALPVTLEDVIMEDTPKRIERNDQIQFALDVARGVQALHDHGVVHADLQLKQFLMDNNGRVKINDFNRCRFLAEDEQHHACEFRIPTAPGKQRSPEEYLFESLTEKLDIYATANMLYAIFTREKPWGRHSSAEAKRLIQKGYLPEMPGVHADLVQLTHRTYARNPSDRPNATELVQALERLL